VSVKVTGVNKFKQKMRLLGDSFDEAVDEGVFGAALEIQGYARKSIQEVSPGATVVRYSQDGNPYSHVAAARGQAPNTDTGNLVNAIQVEKMADSIYRVGATAKAPYATYLEFTHPWLQPSLESNRGAVKRNIIRSVNNAIDRLAI
jgi:hypothetical protein